MVEKPELSFQFEPVLLFENKTTQVRTTAPILVPTKAWELPLTNGQEDTLHVP